MKISVVAMALALSACVSVDVHETHQRSGDATLTALMHAQPKACPAASVDPNARSSGPTARVGVTETLVSSVPMAGDPAHRVVRMRRLVVAPGGNIQWHEHTGRQGFGVVIAGEMTEYRNTCREPMRYHAGDVVEETSAVAHYWQNEGSVDGVILGVDVFTPQ